MLRSNDVPSGRLPPALSGVRCARWSGAAGGRGERVDSVDRARARACRRGALGGGDGVEPSAASGGRKNEGDAHLTRSPSWQELRDPLVREYRSGRCTDPKLPDIARYLCHGCLRIAQRSACPLTQEPFRHDGETPQMLTDARVILEKPPSFGLTRFGGGRDEAWRRGRIDQALLGSEPG
jgi:hypothetical protein